MGQLLLIVTSALVVGAIVFGVSVLITGGDPGLEAAEPDGRAVPLPSTRPLVETDLTQTRFDTALRGYRMAQVDQTLNRVAYDIGYKDELITVLEAEINALRSGRFEDAEVLRRAREAAIAGTSVAQEAGSKFAGRPAPSEVDLGLIDESSEPDKDGADRVDQAAVDGEASAAAETEDSQNADDPTAERPANPTQAKPEQAGDDALSGRR